MSNPEVIVAVDPGVTTGIAVRVTLPDSRRYYTVNCMNPQEVWSFLTTAAPDVVILEQFAASGRIDDNCAKTLEMCGWVKAFVNLMKPVYVSHTPAYRKAFLKQAASFLDILKPGMSRTDHEKDSMAHLLRWEDNQRIAFAAHAAADEVLADYDPEGTTPTTEAGITGQS